MLSVLRRNPDFRRLWLAQVVSQLGDWLSRVAVLGLIGSLGGREAVYGIGMLYAGELAIRLMPLAVLSPLAGPLADRLPRRLLMVVSDLLRAGLVLCLLVVDRPDELWLLYAILIAQMSAATFFEAARSAAIPSTVSERGEIHEAYALSAATWSAMLAIGALLGAIGIRFLGSSGLFVLDSLTYVASAVVLVGLRLPPVPEHPERFSWRDVVTLRDVRRGLDHARELGVLPALLAKTFWGGAGGFLVLLSVAGLDHAAPSLREADAAMTTAVAGFATGLLYGARGLGTGIGPLLARRLWGSGDKELRRQVALGFFVGGTGYLLFGFAGTLAAALPCVVYAHMGGSTIWVAATTLWQKRIDDAFRGRVFACEFLGFTVAFTVGAFLAGLSYDATGSVAVTSWTVASVVIVMGVAWTAWAEGLLPGLRARG